MDNLKFLKELNDINQTMKKSNAKGDYLLGFYKEHILGFSIDADGKYVVVAKFKKDKYPELALVKITKFIVMRPTILYDFLKVATKSIVEFELDDIDGLKIKYPLFEDDIVFPCATKANARMLMKGAAVITKIEQSDRFVIEESEDCSKLADIIKDYKKIPFFIWETKGSKLTMTKKVLPYDMKKSTVAIITDITKIDDIERFTRVKFIIEAPKYTVNQYIRFVNF